MTTAAEFNYQPREQFVDFHQRHQRNALMVCHRRMGKTVGCIGEAVVRAIHSPRPDARYAYVAPFRQQAKEIAWVYLKNMTEGLRSEAPRESELRVKLYNGAWITLYGADNPDALRGLYFDGIILDEFGDMKPSLMGEVILPCLADRLGWLVIIGTAKGRNQFFKYMKTAQDNPDEWYYKMAKASETGLIDKDELERLRRTMGDDKYEQEMECSFDAAIAGAYYADAINKLDKEGRIVRDEHLFEPSQKVHVAADCGLRDTTAWWFWQPRPDGYAIIDYYEASGKYMDHYLHMLYDKGYEYHEIWLPFDAKAKTLATRRSTMEQLRNPYATAQMYADTELANKYPDGTVLPIRQTPKLGIQHGIDAVRSTLPRCYFDGKNCASGLDALRSYQRQYHEHTDAFSDTPLHNWASNGADAFRYLSLVAQRSVAMAAERDFDPNMPDTYGLGQQGQSGVGLQLQQLFEDRERGNGNRYDIIRIR